MTRRSTLIALAAAALVAVFAIGLAQSGGTSVDRAAEPAPSKRSARDAQRALAGAPAPLARLYARANQIVPASPKQVKARIAGLRGYPVVVNKWASWCGPCRREFPLLQDVSVRYGKRVAFLGLNAGDRRADAKAFLKRYPVPYPSFEDPSERAAFALGASTNFPVTLFYDRDGKQVYLHQGAYAGAVALSRDIERYALGTG